MNIEKHLEPVYEIKTNWQELSDIADSIRDKLLAQEESKHPVDGALHDRLINILNTLTKV